MHPVFPLHLRSPTDACAPNRLNNEFTVADKLEQLKAKVQAEGGEILAKSAVVGHDNNRLTEVLEKERLKKEKLAAKRAEREKKKKEAKGIVDEEWDEPAEEEKKGKKKNKKKNQDQ